MASDKQDNSVANEKIVETAETELDAAVELAFTRTELAFDRTLLAWIRTALTLMAAGIAYDKGFQLLHEARLEEGTAWVRSAHVVGIALTAASTLLLIVVTVNYFMNVRALAAFRRRGIAQALPTVLAALLVILLGCSVLTVLVATSP
jgi:inner membrane protein YidH